MSANRLAVSDKLKKNTAEDSKNAKKKEIDQKDNQIFEAYSNLNRLEDTYGDVEQLKTGIDTLKKYQQEKFTELDNKSKSYETKQQTLESKEDELSRLQQTKNRLSEQMNEQTSQIEDNNQIISENKIV